MKIGHKLILGFVGLASLMAALGYVALRASRTTLEEAIGKSSCDLADHILNKIDRNIVSRIEEIQAYSTDELAKEQISLSNAHFENVPNLDFYIEQVESEWSSEGNIITPLISQLSGNELARGLRSRQDFYLNKYGYSLLAEMFVTNKFGVNIAQTNKTTDYYQADEEWWQCAKQNGLFVSDIKYDESSGTFSYDIGVRINDANGSFIGVVKAVINSQETINAINEAKANAGYKTTQLHLLNRDGKILYSTKSYTLFEDATEQLVPRFGKPGQPNHKYFVVGQKEGEKGILFAHVHSKGHKDFRGLGWTFLMETDTKEVFAPIANLWNTMLLSGLAVLCVALLTGSITYRSIVIPIVELQKATVQIAAGNLDPDLQTGEDEIGQLAHSFQKMAQQLKKTITDLNAEIAERTKAENGLRESESHFRTILDNIQTGIFIIDPETHSIVYANPIAARLTGASSEQLVGSVCHKFICPAEKGHCPITDLGQQIDNAESILLTIKGKKRQIIKTVETIMLNGKKHLLESFVDITEQKNTEWALEKLNKALESTIGELSRSNKQLQDFVHIAAHDLKTPVRGIGTLADWIISDYGDKLDEHGREQVRLLKARVIRIDKLIEGMLQFSKITRTRKNEKKINLNTLLTDAVNKIKPPDNIEIAVDSMPTVTCEYDHISQVFQNLLSNAIMFMDKPKGLIKVGCVEQGDFWKFYVCDNGPGIDQKHFDRIFKIFQTLPKKDQIPSAGIGLAIAKKIIELYGGKIWIESRLGTGSTFFFTLPKQQEEIIYEHTKSHTSC